MATRIGSSNIYLKIKDKTLKLDERLNLLRYAWKFSNVYIPNKEQVLVDILTGFLLNQKKERLNKDDVDRIWKCLQDVLQTKKASEPNKILLRQSSTQMLIDSLLAANENSGYILPLIGCFDAIMKSDSLSAVFTHKLETMVLILEGFCQVLTLTTCKHKASLSSAIHHTVDRFNETLKTAPGQNQILTKLCDHVLPKFLGLWSSKPPDSVKKISTAILEVLSHRDHHQNYDVYLKAKHSPAGGHIHKKAKPVEHLFSTLAKLLQTNEESCSLYLPVVFENYIKQNCHKGIQLTVHYLMVEFCTMIGLRSDNNDLSGPIKSSVIFRTLHELLKIIQGRELYEQFLDEKNELVQLKFYKHVVHVLTDFRQSLDDETDEVFSDWYSTMTIFIEMNHYIVELKLVEIFSIGWINAKVKEEDIEALDNMLCELMTTYSKLRQVPKLILKLLGTLCVCDDSNTLQLTPRFQTCYGEVIQNLPQGTMLDVWKKFAASLKGLFVSDETKHDTGHFQGICLLFHHFLLNVKVADYTVTELTLKSVQDLLVVMETEILAPLLKETLENKDMSKLKHTLFLSQAWGEVVAMLALYKKFRASEFQTKVLVSHEGDLSYVHGYLETKQWMKLYKIVTEHADKSLIYVWETLMIQKVRTVLVFRGVTDWSMMSDTMATFINNFEDADKKEDNASWTGRLEDVTETSLLTARWRLLTSNMAAIYAVLSDEQIKIVADFIVKCMVTFEPQKKIKNGLNLRDISMKFLESTVLRESGCLLSSLVTSVWRNCGVLFSGRNIKSPKKKKQDTMTTNVSILMGILGDSDISWTQQIDSGSMEKLKEASEVLAVISNSTEFIHVADPSQLQACVKIIHCLPLEHLWSCDQIRCLTGLLAVKCLTEKLENQSENESLKCLSSDCVEMCTFILESCGLVPVFDVINAESFLDWLHNLLHSTTVGTPEYYKCLVLAEVTCQAIVKDHTSVDKLSPIVDKLCKENKKSQGSESLTLTYFLLQEICKLLSKPFLKDTLQDSCKKMYKSLSKSVIKLSPLLESSTRNHMEAVLVRTYAVVLTTMQKSEKIQKAFLEEFPQMFQWCETTLQNVDTTEVYVVLSALIFLQTMSKHHILLKLQLTIEDKFRIWKLLTSVLKKILSTQSTEEQPQSLNQSMETENQSHSQNLDQSADNMSGKGTQSSKSHKKKRKSDNKLENQSNDSVSHDTKTNEDLESQMAKISKLLEGPLENSETTENAVDLVNDKLVALDSPTFKIDNAVLNPTMLISLCRSLMFEGQLESQRSKVIKMQVQSVLAALLVTFDLDQFKEVLQDLVDSVDPGLLYTDRGRIQSAVYIWRHLIKLEFTDEQNKVIKYTAKDMMLNFQCIIQQVQYVQTDDVIIELTIPILYTQQEMLTAGMKFLASRNSILCIFSCLYTPLCGRTYFPAFNAVYSVLDTLLVHHCDTVFQNIPSFIGCAKRLLLSVVEESNQDKISQQPDVVKQLMSCAYHMERLFSLISTHKVEFGKVAIYVVSDYVTAVQKVTLLPAIKRALVPAVYKMLDLCDKHAISQLHVVLSHGVTEVFRLLYKEYKRFYKYQGKI